MTGDTTRFFVNIALESQDERCFARYGATKAALSRLHRFAWFNPFRPCRDRSMGRKKGFTGRTHFHDSDAPPAEAVAPRS